MGIVPILDDAGAVISPGRYRKEKLMLWHRFAFLVLKDALRASQTGVEIDGKMVYSRFVMVVAVKVQERPSCGLKVHGALWDCTLCYMPSRKPIGVSHVRKRRKGEILIHYTNRRVRAVPPSAMVMRQTRSGKTTIKMITRTLLV